MRAQLINEGAKPRSKKHWELARKMMNADEGTFEDIVYEIMPDVVGNIFSKDVVAIANQVAEEDIDIYLEQLNEWGGAGMSMSSSIFPTNRGGQSGRSGFGGASNLGGPNMMYTYEIKSLNRYLQPKPNDYSQVEVIRVGNLIQGEELNKRDGSQHKGILLKAPEAEDGSLMYYMILCDETNTMMKIDPTTAVMLSGNVDVQVADITPGDDFADLDEPKYKDQPGPIPKFKSKQAKVKFVH